MKKIFTIKSIAIVLLFMTVLTMLASCKPETGLGEGSTSSEAVTSGEVISEVTTEEPRERLDIIKDKKTEYAIVRSSKASDGLSEIIQKLRNACNGHMAPGKLVPVESDYLMKDQVAPESAKEIVVGPSNRPENAALEAECGDREYVILEKNDRIYIYAKNDKKIAEAVDYFIANYIDKEGVFAYKGMKDVFKHSYRWKELKIDGTPIEQYKVVVPASADTLTVYAADNFIQYIKAATGKTLSVITDKQAESDCEILFGNTSRKASARAYAEVKGGKYVLWKNGKQIVTAGEGYLVGAGAAALLNRFTGEGDTVDITSLPTEPRGEVYQFNEKPTSAILMIGDGMADNHILATLKSGLKEFVPMQLPNKGHAVTHSKNYPKVTDSAASATALSSGYKTYNGYLGLTSSKFELPNVREIAYSKGAKTAVITTDKITGATPGGFLVHVDDRNSTEVIQAQINKLIKENKVDYCEGDVGDSFRAKITEALYGMTDGRQKIFAMFEAALIDKRSHSNDLSGIYQMVRRYNDVTTYVIEYILFHPDTALVITADHECGGVTLNNATGQYYFTSGNHTNANVPVFALGSGTQIFNGKTVDNTYIARFLAGVFAPGEKFGE